MQGWCWLGLLLTGLLAGCGGESADRTDRLVIDPPPGTVALQGIEVSPAQALLARDMPLKLRAIAVLTSGGILDVSDKVDWRSSDEAIATVANDGAVTVLATGGVTFSASLYNKTGEARLTISDARLQVIDVEPPTATLLRGTTLQLAASGGFSDGSRQDLGTQVTWESNRPDIVAIDAGGRLLALAAGEALVTARFESGPGTWLAGSARVTVTEASLSRVNVVPATLALVTGGVASLKAVGDFDNGSSADLTEQVAWSSSDAALAIVGNGLVLPSGHLVAGDAGEVVITATLGDLTAEAVATISEARLTGLRINASRQDLASGEKMDLVAIGDFSDGSDREMTDQVIWSSSDTRLAQVSNAPASRARVTAAAGGDGVVTITASRQGVAPASFEIMVRDEPRRPVSMLVQAVPNVILDDGSDTTTLMLQLLAADPARVVADGTAIDVEIRDGQGALVLPATRLTTSAGAASLDFSTAIPGLLQVRAVQPDSGVSQSTVLLSTTDLTAALSATGSVDPLMSDQDVPIGRDFGARILNTSNRDLRLLRWVFCNGQIDAGDGACLGEVLAEMAYPADRRLSGGAIVDAGATLLDEVPDNGVSASFFFEDGGRPFRLHMAY